MVFLRDFVGENSPYFHSVKDQLVLSLPLAILLQNPLVFGVQLVDVDIGKVVVESLGPGIGKVRGLLQQSIDLPAEVLKRLPVLGVDLGVVEQAEVGDARDRQRLLLGLDGKRWAHCLKLSFL